MSILDFFRKEKCSICEDTYRKSRLINIGGKEFCSYECFKAHCSTLTTKELLEFAEYNNELKRG